MTCENNLPTASQLVPGPFSVSYEVSAKYGIFTREPSCDLSESDQQARSLFEIHGTKYLIDCLGEIGTAEFGKGSVQRSV